MVILVMIVDENNIGIIIIDDGDADNDSSGDS